MWAWHRRRIRRGFPEKKMTNDERVVRAGREQNEVERGAKLMGKVRGGKLEFNGEKFGKKRTNSDDIYTLRNLHMVSRMR